MRQSDPDFGTDGLLRFLAKSAREAVANSETHPVKNAFNRFAKILDAKADEYNNHNEGCDCDYCLR